MWGGGENMAAESVNIWEDAPWCSSCYYGAAMATAWLIKIDFDKEYSIMKVLHAPLVNALASIYRQREELPVLPDC